MYVRGGGRGLPVRRGVGAPRRDAAASTATAAAGPAVAILVAGAVHDRRLRCRRVCARAGGRGHHPLRQGDGAPRRDAAASTATTAAGPAVAILAAGAVHDCRLRCRRVCARRGGRGQPLRRGFAPPQRNAAAAIAASATKAIKVGVPVVAPGLLVVAAAATAEATAATIAAGGESAERSGDGGKSAGEPHPWRPAHAITSAAAVVGARSRTGVA